MQMPLRSAGDAPRIPIAEAASLLLSNKDPNYIACDLGDFRNYHIFLTLAKMALDGKKVFAVIGSTHVQMMHPALVAALGKPVRVFKGTPSLRSRTP
jgi:hypothetical protein